MSKINPNLKQYYENNSENIPIYTEQKSLILYLSFFFLLSIMIIIIIFLSIKRKTTKIKKNKNFNLYNITYIL